VEETKKGRPWKERINFNVIGALCFILFSIVFYFLIPSQIEKPKFAMGRSLVDMKPSLFPQITMLTLLGLSIWYLFQSFRLKESNLLKELPAKRYIKTAVSIGFFLAYAILFEPLGFVVSSMLLLGSLPLYYGYRRVPVYILICMGFPLGVYLLFTRVLKVSLPEFPFF
jgi:putative tricarboxylic transport membrane protein